MDKILDTAGQKGTGKWTVVNSQDLGIPITLIAEAVYSRCVSALKDERVKAARKLKGPRPVLTDIATNAEKKKPFIADIRDALYASKIVSYAQGYMLMRAAAKEYGWNLNYGGIALMWRGGCIIRSRFLGKIKEAYDKNPKLANLLLDDYFRGEIKRCQKGWRNIVATAAKKGIPVPAFSTALAFYDQYRSAVLPANLLQAQRDYFGAHTYERVDQPRGKILHTNWTGHGGTTSAAPTPFNDGDHRFWSFDNPKVPRNRGGEENLFMAGGDSDGNRLRHFWRGLSWRRWPDPLIDFGQQLYVPWRLSRGAILVSRCQLRLWLPVGLLSRVLFKIFGVSLNVILVSNFLILIFLLLLVYRLFLKCSDVMDGGDRRAGADGAGL